ncbi:hypothetical protein Trydic_g11996 [Trypoxylus dichotomus]
MVIETARELHLRQLNDITNLNGQLLDLILTNLDVEFAVAHDLAPFVGEDAHHPALDILINLDLPSDPLDFPSNRSRCKRISRLITRRFGHLLVVGGQLQGSLGACSTTRSN